MRKHAKSYIQIFLRTNNYEPIDVEVKTYLDLRGRLDLVSWITPNEHSKIDHLTWKEFTLVDPTDAVKYSWVEAQVVGTLFILNTEATIEVADIMANDPQDWLVLLVGPDNRVCNSFDDCTAPLYKCMFIKI